MERRLSNIEWCEELSVGIPEIDEDHRRCLSLINQFNRCNVGRMELREVKKRLQAILDDVEKHFASEERLFKEWQCPELDEHACMHEQTIKALNKIKTDILTYGYDWEWQEASMKIKEVLINHVLKEDMKYVDYYLKSRNASNL